MTWKSTVKELWRKSNERPPERPRWVLWGFVGLVVGVHLAQWVVYATTGNLILEGFTVVSPVSPLLGT